MSNFRKNKQYTDQEINVFQEIETNKIMSNLQEPTSFKWAYKLVLGLVILVLAAVLFNSTLGNKIVPNPLEEGYVNIQKIGATSFLAQSIDEDNTFYFYYTAHIVHENEPIKYDEMYSYYKQYDYAPEALFDKVEIDYQVYRVDEYRYIAMVTINNQVTYSEYDSFPSHSRSTGITGMEIDDLKKDIDAVFALIETYPPVLITTTPYPKYEAHPDVANLEDSKDKRNYIQYVENTYTYEEELPENTHNQDHITSVLLNDLIVVDSEGNIEHTSSYIQSYSGKHVTPSEMSNVVDNSFKYIKTDGTFLGGMSSDFSNFTDDITGRMQSYHDMENLNHYTYITISKSKSVLDLSKASKLKFEYELHSMFQDSQTGSYEIVLPLYETGGILFTDIIPITSYEHQGIISVITTFTITIYDADDNIIGTIETPY